MHKELLVVGGGGLVGSRFTDLYRLKYSILNPTTTELDITSESQVIAFLFKHCPYAIINFAAFTNVGLAEDQVDNKAASCWQINVVGTRNLYQHKDPSTFFLQISTDMVFPGDSGPYSEDHPVAANPAVLTWYGYTKAVSEKVIAVSRDAILRLIY